MSLNMCRALVWLCVASALVAFTSAKNTKLLDAVDSSNWALAQKTTQSSVGNWCGATLDQPCYSSYAVDGDFNQKMNLVAPYTAYHSSSSPSPHFWRVDLGAHRPIGQITLYLRKDCCLERNTMSVWLSSDLVVANSTARMPNGWQVGEVTHPMVAVSPNQVFQINIQPAVYARHVEVRSTSWFLTLSEVVVGLGVPVCSVNNGNCGSASTSLCTTSAWGSNAVVCQCMAGYTGAPNCQPQSRFQLVTGSSRDWQPLTRATVEHIHPLGLRTWEVWFDCRGNRPRSVDCNFDMVRMGDTNAIGVVTLNTPIGAQPGKSVLDITAKIAVSYGYQGDTSVMPAITLSLVSGVNDTNDGDVLGTQTPTMSNYPMFDSCNLRSCFSEIEFSITVPAGHGALDTPKYLRLTVNNGNRHNLHLLTTATFKFHVDQRAAVDPDPCANNGNCGPSDSTQCTVGPFKNSVCKCRDLYDGMPPWIPCKVINACSINNGGCGSNTTSSCGVTYSGAITCACLGGYMGNPPQLSCAAVQSYMLTTMSANDWTTSLPSSVVHVAPLSVAADTRTCRVPSGSLGASFCDFDYLNSGNAYDAAGAFTMNFGLAAHGKIISAIQATLSLAYGSDGFMSPMPSIQFSLVDNPTDRWAGDVLGSITPQFTDWPLLGPCTALMCFKLATLNLNSTFGHGSLSTPKYLRLTINNGGQHNLAMLPVASIMVTYANAATVNDCASNNGGCGPWMTTTCMPDVEGHAMCTCQTGYSGNPPFQACAAVNLCATDNGGCGDGATCTLDAYRHTVCKCVTGYTGQPPTFPCTKNTGSTLAQAAAKSGRFFGTAVCRNDLDNADEVVVLDREFNMLTPASCMLWDVVEPARGVFTYDMADAVVTHGLQHQMRIRGYALVPTKRLPAWVSALADADVPAVITSHVASVASHFKGKIYSWDVVSEAFADNAPANTLVSSKLMRFDYISLAFKVARAADPQAKLCYNDVGIEGLNAKSDSVYAMVQSMISQGVPIDCVGMQAHLLNNALPDTFQQNMQRFSDLGIDVQITQLDVGGDFMDGQSQTYAAVMKACTAVTRCVGITVWGVGDAVSWRAGEKPLLFDDKWKAKPAYTATLAALNGVARTTLVSSSTIADWLAMMPASVAHTPALNVVPFDNPWDKCNTDVLGALDYQCDFDFIRTGSQHSSATVTSTVPISAHPYQYIESLTAQMFLSYGFGTQLSSVLPSIEFSIVAAPTQPQAGTVIGRAIPLAANYPYSEKCNARACYLKFTMKVDATGNAVRAKLDTAQYLRLTVKNEDHNLLWLPAATFTLALSAPISKTNDLSNPISGGGATSSGGLTGIVVGGLVVVAAAAAGGMWWMKRRAAAKQGTRVSRHVEMVIETSKVSPAVTCQPPTPRSTLKPSVELSTTPRHSAAGETGTVKTTAL